MTSMGFRTRAWLTPVVVATGAVLATAAIWLAHGAPAGLIGSADSVSKTDAARRVGRDRARSVVVLHSIKRSAPTARGDNWYLQSVIETLGTGRRSPPRQHILVGRGRAAGDRRGLI